MRCVQVFFLFALLICHTARAEDIVYLDPFLDMRAFEGEVELYTPDYESFHVALSSLKTVLEIHLEYPSSNINMSNSNKIKEITGWVFYQNALVSSDLAHKKITIAGKTYLIEGDDFIEFEDVIYLNSKALNRWFDINIMVDMNRLMVNFNTKGRHPYFEAIKRKFRYNQIDGFKKQVNKTVAYDNQYQWINWPSSDIRISKTLSNNSQTSVVSSAVLDLFGHGVNVLASGNNTQSNYRFKAQREVDLLGNQFNYALGDVFFPAGKFLRASFSGRGVAIRGNQLTQNFAKSFQVEGLPGWTVELYRGDQLIDYSQLDERGQYRFEGVNISAGQNDYKAVLYGPNGEMKEKRFNFNVSNQGLYKGKWQPELYFIEPDIPTFGDAPAHERLFDKLAVGRVNYGLTDHINLGVGSIVDSANAKYNTTFAEMLYLDENQLLDIGIGDNNQQDQMPYSVDYSINSTLGIFSLSNYSAYLFDQDSFEQGTSAGWENNFTDYDVSFKYQQHTQGQNSISRYEANLGARIGVNQITNKFAYTDSTNFATSMLARIVINDNLFQVRADYTKTAGNINKQLNVAWRKKFGKHSVRINTGYQTYNNSLKVIADYSAQFDGYQLGAKLTHDSIQKSSLSLNFSTAFAWDAPFASQSPQSYNSSARIRTRAYWDKNANQKFDGNDEPIKGVKYKVGQKTGGSSDANGKAVIYGVQSYHPQLVQVDTSEMENPFMAPLTEQYRVTSHPGGEVTLDIPFYENFEVEGDVKVSGINAQTKGKSSVPVYLMQDGNIVKQVTTEYDGYFLFNEVLPGDYQVSIGEDYLKDKSLSVKTEKVRQFKLVGGTEPLMVLDAFVLKAVK